MRLRTLPSSHPSSRFQDVLDEKVSTSTQRIRNQMWIYPQIVGSWLHTRNHAGRTDFGRWPPSFGSLIFWLTLRWRVFPGKSECLPVNITKMYQNINIVFSTRRMCFLQTMVFLPLDSRQLACRACRNPCVSCSGNCKLPSNSCLKMCLASSFPIISTYFSPWFLCPSRWCIVFPIFHVIVSASTMPAHCYCAWRSRIASDIIGAASRLCLWIREF